MFFPAYNDSGTIASLVITALRTARTLTADYEVIVVNDGSADGTAEILDELARTYPQVRIVHHAKNRGYGGALRTGFATATRELVFYTDGDAQYDPAEMDVLWHALGDGVDLVNGYKISRSDPLHRIVIGRIYHHTVQAAVRAQGPRRRLRFPPDAALDLRHGAPREEQRRHLPGDDEEDPGRRLPHRRGAGAPLPPRLRQVAVLQLRRLYRTAIDVMKLWFALVIRREHLIAPRRTPLRSPSPRVQGPSVTDSYREFYRGRRVLVTGGLGFIGSNLARRLVDLGADVLVVDSMIPEYGGNLFNLDGVEDRLRINIGDVRNETIMDLLVRDREVIFNLAGQVSHIDSMLDPYTDLDINCRAQLSMLEACRKHNPGVKVVFAGTRQVYGKPDRLPVDETASGPSDGRQRREQGRRRVLPPALQQRLRHPRVLPAPDQRLRPAPAHSPQSAGVHRLVHPTGH